MYVRKLFRFVLIAVFFDIYLLLCCLSELCCSTTTTAATARVRLVLGLAAACCCACYEYHRCTTMYQLFLPCGMPACVTPWGPPHSLNGSVVCKRIGVVYWCVFAHISSHTTWFTKIPEVCAETGRRYFTIQVQGHPAPRVTRGVRSKTCFRRE